FLGVGLFRGFWRQAGPCRVWQREDRESAWKLMARARSSHRPAPGGRVAPGARTAGGYSALPHGSVPFTFFTFFKEEWLGFEYFSFKSAAHDWPPIFDLADGHSRHNCHN